MGRVAFALLLAGCGGGETATPMPASAGGETTDAVAPLARDTGNDPPTPEVLATSDTSEPIASIERFRTMLRDRHAREAGLSLTRAGESRCEEVASTSEGGEGRILEAAAFSTTVRQGNPEEVTTSLDLGLRTPEGWLLADTLATLYTPPNTQIEVGARIGSLAIRQVVPEGPPEVVVEYTTTSVEYEYGEAIETTLREDLVAVCGDAPEGPTCYAIVPRLSEMLCVVYPDRIDPFAGGDRYDFSCPNRRDRYHDRVNLQVRIGADGILTVSTRQPVGDRLGPLIGRFDLRTERVRPSD